MYTRQQGNSQLVSTENPEDLVRKAWRNSMAYPGHRDPKDNFNNENNNEQSRNIPLLYVPDLANTILSEAIKDGMQVGNTGTEYIIPTPLLKEVIGMDRLKVILPEGELETCSDPPLDFITKCQPTPFNLQILRGTLKDMRKDNPELQYLVGDNWRPTHSLYLRRQELKERLNAYTELSVKYAKSIIELDVVQLVFDMDERLTIEYSLKLLIQHITNRLDEILSILARDNMLRKRGKKRVYTLPRINPRAANFNSTDDIQKIGREIQDDVQEIMDYAFNPNPEGEESSIQVCDDGSDIPNDNTWRNCGVDDWKTNKAPTDQNNPTRPNVRQNSDKTHHTVNFDDREQHRTSALEDVQQKLTQMAQKDNNTNTENVRHARPNNEMPNSRRWRNMAERHQQANVQDTNSSAASNSGMSTDWDGRWGTQECSACGQDGHNSRSCRARRSNELWCTRCNRNNHCNNTCRLAPRRSSTPRYTDHYNQQPSPHIGNDQTVPPVEPHFSTRPSPVFNNQGTGNLELSQMLQTILRENSEEAKLKQQQKNLMANIPTFNGKDKKACLMWVNHVEHTARQAKMTLREAVTSKAGPTVVTAISRYPNASDAQLKRIILESFSNVGTRTEASHYLKMMRIDNNDSLIAHNAEYEAVHTVAYGISAEEQNDEQILRAYANTLCSYAATKLNRKIIRRGSRIRTLKDAMEEAEILESQSRQEEISKLERDSIRDTTVSDSINDISLTEESVNFMQMRRGDGKLNSTIKNNHQSYSPGNRQSYHSNYNNSKNFNNLSRNWSPQQNRFNRRRLQRYRHQPRWPRHNIKFEYNARDKNMMGTLEEQ